MATRMLIDARHPEETRVAVVKGNRIEEFDFEAAARQQIKGNIYLAKVTRVEPSLQAAFVDYGGNRHGFLAFSEIHPDYYQIPKEDREALLREEQRLADEAARYESDDDTDDAGETTTAGEADDQEAENDAAGDAGDDAESADTNGDATTNGNGGPEDHGNTEEAGAEALRRRRMALRRRYKIQEVIRRRQVMLVQVVKDERGNKGAALTTYISLAGRYSVLMPNTAHGGGISRKIANVADRRRLKAIMADLNLPKTMGAIVRTAGLERTRAEISRDFDYLTRLWDEIREKTLTSSAPALIYEDSDLIKRAIRDIYSREIDEVLVDGDEGYRQARDFIKLLMPTHARKVQPYVDAVPLFHRAGVEAQLAALLNPVVNLKSGGYIVINPTEALVAIDVNSGRSTREYNIEETALKTNIEAAEEVARQLRLRDLAGLVVVDFIDMDVHANNRKVERALKEALKSDRARIQVGRISAFGLLEMSRQRLRTGVLEASTEPCPTCAGIGLVSTPGSAALAALRLLEEDAVKGHATLFRLRIEKSVAIYMLNRKRSELTELEQRYGIHIEVQPDDSQPGGRAAIDASGPPPAQPPKRIALAAPPPSLVDEVEEIEADDESGDEIAEARESAPREGGRRRRRRGGRGRSAAHTETTGETDRDQDGEDQTDEGSDTESAGAHETETASGEQEERRRRRRRRRTPRRDGGTDNDVASVDTDSDDQHEETGEIVEAIPAEPAEIAQTQEAEPAELLPTRDAAAEPVDTAPVPETPEEAPTVLAVVEETPAAPAKPAPRRRTPRRKAEPAAEAATETDTETPVEAEIAEEAAAKPAPRRRTTRRKAEPAEDAAAGTAAEAPAEGEAAAEAAAKPAPRRRTTRRKAEPTAETAAETATETPAEGEAVAEAPAKRAPRRTRTTKVAAAAEEATAPPVDASPVDVPSAEPLAETTAAEAPEATPAVETPADTPDGEEDGSEPRRGWWQRTFGN
ncbi:MAG: Rne/Rng family ribonuclease [Sphingomonadaceae bacterium]